jgi:hypothetical protein
MLVATAFLFAGTQSFAQAPELRGGAMLDCSGLPCVDATLANGKHLKLLVDTGDYNSTLDTEVAKQLGFDVAPVNGQDGKPIPGYGKTVLSGLKIGDGSLGDVKVLVMDLAQSVKDDHMPACDGTITYTAFKDRLLQLDYVKRQVRFSEVLAHAISCGETCGEITTPTFGKKGPPIVVATGFFVNQKPITAQIDTLFAGTMLIYPTSVDKLGLKTEASSPKKRFFPYTDDGVDMFEATAKTEAFGGHDLAGNAPLYFAGPTVHLPDGMFDGTVGHELFARSVLNLNFHDMKFWIE